MIDRKKVKAKAAAHAAAQGEGGADVANIGVGKPWRKSWLVLMEAVNPRADERIAKLRPKVDWAIQDFAVWDARLKTDPRQGANDLSASLFYKQAEFGTAVLALVAGFRKGHLTISPDRWRHIGQKIERLLETIGQYQPK